jgi:hypothetical protein
VVVPYATVVRRSPPVVRLAATYATDHDPRYACCIMWPRARRRGRIVATFDDYAVIRELVEPVFRGSVSSG